MGRLVILGCLRHVLLWPCTCEQWGRTEVSLRQQPPVALHGVSLGTRQDGGCQSKGQQRVQLCPSPAAGMVPAQPGALLGVNRLCSMQPCSGLQHGHSSTQAQPAKEPSALLRVGISTVTVLHGIASACRYFCMAVLSPVLSLMDLKLA